MDITSAVTSAVSERVTASVSGRPLTPNADANKLYNAAVQSNLFSGGYVTANGENRCAILYPLRIGSGDRKNLVLAFNGWRLSSTATLINFSYTIEEIYVQANSQLVRASFGGSTAPKAIVGGDNDIQSDALLPSQFGLSVFAKGSSVLVKFIISFTPGATIGYADSRSNAVWGPSSAQHWFYNSDNTTITNRTGLGAYTRTGVAANNKDSGVCPVVLGAFAPGARAATFMTIGSSTGAGNNDSKNYTAGSGMFARAMQDIPSSRYRAHLHWAASGSSITGQTQSKVTYWLRYADVYIDQLGANSVDAQSVAQMQSDVSAVWTIARGLGVRAIIRTHYNPYTTSTDAWTTTANQTPRTNWGVGGRADQLNIWANGRVTAGVIEAVFPVDAFRAPENDRLWAVTGAANYGTDDGQHGKTALHTLGAAELNGILTTIEAQLSYPV